MSIKRPAATTVELRPKRAPLDKRPQSAISTRREQGVNISWARCVTDPGRSGCSWGSRKEALRKRAACVEWNHRPCLVSGLQALHLPQHPEEIGTQLRPDYRADRHIIDHGMV